MSATTYDLCDNCSSAIANDDYSGLEFYSDHLATRVKEFAKSAGVLVISPDEVELDTQCDSCKQVIDGHGHTAQKVH
ncbi:hypothetical protein [Rhodococcus pyridinivorans]|uniref:hypothetical protein n=1 Tax=Rhodococcus pyridinivorans TaxID=103816 RepID=UPI002658EDA9|nr:hypothetical protein [Rhodococcus pyridinivorans]